MPFGDKLLQLLNEKEISQKEFAAELNIAPTTLNGYIKNKRQPDFGLLKEIAAALSVSTDYLLDYDSGFTLSAEEHCAVSKLRQLSDEQRSIIYDLIDVTYEKSRPK